MSGLEVLVPLFTAGASVAGTVAAASNKPKLPKPEPVRPMPDPESPQALEARRLRVAERRAGADRESTNLVDETYSNTLLGQ